MAAVEGARACLRVRRKGAAAPPPLPVFMGGGGGDAHIAQWGLGWGALARATVSFPRLMSYSSGMWDVVRLSECGG